LPRNLGELLAGFDNVVVPEMNKGQLSTVLRSEYLIPAEPMTKVTGKPFKVSEILDAIKSRMERER
jgi:2-oxoglutarate ferredoxin oxidoreductase subunit alpha